MEWLGGVIETDEAEVAGNMGGGAENGGSVGGGAEADVPDNEFAGGPGEAFWDVKLTDVEEIGLSLRAKPGVHFFAVARAKQGALSVGEGYELVVIRHGGIVGKNLRDGKNN